ncbi:MAG: hypothetical protein IJ282_07870 [Lachnospiraceae bacterium]|nr:hypothetical protein [Lachnospiraceae bacterium]
MLGKLLKHEWRSTWKLPTALSAFTILMTLLGALSFKMPMWQKLVGNNPSSVTFVDLVAVAILITYFITIVVSAYAIMIYFSVRFYKNLYTDEGYLMHTLPTTPRNLIFSKTVISSFWNVISTTLMMASMFWLFDVFMKTLLTEAEWKEVSAAFAGISPSINEIFIEYSGVSVVFAIFAYILTLLVGSIYGMLLIYLCICIGQLFRKHKVAAAIIAYLVVTTIIQTITSVAVLPATFNMMFKMEAMSESLLIASPMEALVAPFATMMPVIYISLALSAILSIAAFFACEYITKRKLNLD